MPIFTFQKSRAKMQSNRDVAREFLDALQELNANSHPNSITIQNLDLSQSLEDILDSSTGQTLYYSVFSSISEVDQLPSEQTLERDETHNLFIFSTSTPTLSAIQERLPQINEEQEFSPLIAVQPTPRLNVKHSSTISSSSQSNNSSASSNLIETSDGTASRPDQSQQPSRALVVSEQRTSTIPLSTNVSEEPTAPVRVIPLNSRPVLSQRNQPMSRLAAARQVNVPTTRSNTIAAATSQSIASTNRSKATSTLLHTTRQINASNARLTETNRSTTNRIHTTRSNPTASSLTRRPLTNTTGQTATATVRSGFYGLRVPSTSTTTASRTSIIRPQPLSVITNTQGITNTTQSSPASQIAPNSTVRLSKPSEVIGKRNERISENPRNLCDICCDKPKNSVFIPCGHISCCISCSDRVRKERKRCIICNSFVSKTLIVYIT